MAHEDRHPGLDPGSRRLFGKAEFWPNGRVRPLAPECDHPRLRADHGGKPTFPLTFGA